MDEESIFAAALSLASQEERQAYLDRACGDRADLRRQVEELLRASADAGSFIERPALGNLPTYDAADAETSTSHTTAHEVCALLDPCETPGRIGKLGGYEILDVVGSGGMGTVFRGFDVKLRRFVAVKVLSPRLAADSRAAERFLREAQSAAAVHHDHVVTVHAVDDQHQPPFLVMEFVQGRTLQQKIEQEGRLELQQILRIGAQIARGLAAAHRQGLIHRDVKPGNILLMQDSERVKITDFGLAHAADDVENTIVGLVAGTPQYMSPEQARGDAVDFRSDLFSLGSVLYAMCIGRSPFRGESTMAVLRRVCDESPPSPSTINPQIPDWLSSVIEKLHAKVPDQRFSSAAELAESLEDHLARLQLPTTAEPKLETDGTAGSSPNHFLPWTMAGLIALGLLITTLIVTEANGITHLAATIIRIFTPDGTLVVKVDDPSVKVTVEGDGGLVITGAGAQEIRLRPGSYKVQATKDGNPVPLDRELVTISQGGRELVSVRLESPGPAVAGKMEAGAFAVLNGMWSVPAYDTLLDAVQASSPGDTIEVRGNGPFVSRPVKIGHPLTIRAEAGFQPVIVLDPAALDTNVALIWTQSPLVLAGLELRATDAPVTRRWTELIRTENGSMDYAGPLYMANCRLQLSSLNGRCLALESQLCRLRNCALLNAPGYTIDLHCQYQDQERLTIDNCLLAGKQVLSIQRWGKGNASVQVTRSSCVATHTFQLALHISPTEDRAGVPVSLDVSRSVMAATRSILHFGQVAQSENVDAMLPRLFHWRGDHNAYYPAESFLFHTNEDGKRTGPPRIAKLDEWRTFWGSSEANCIQGVVKLKGGDLLAQVASAPETLTPSDFRLRPDSAGYRAGKDGKDLGADIDLVGPGAAYERWKKTPEYQEWLQDIRQIMDIERNTNSRGVAWRLAAEAWRLVISPDPKMRDPQRALELINEALVLDPGRVSHHNILGVVQYRAGNYPAARESLMRAMPARGGGDCADWFFLAMVDFRLGDKTKAREWFDKGVELMKIRQHPQWPSFRAEAADLLQIEDKPRRKDPAP